MHITLDNGRTLTATQSHPFKTTEGWRDAILLKKGGKLLLKGGDGSDEADLQGDQSLVQAKYSPAAIQSIADDTPNTIETGEHVIAIRDVRIEVKTIPVFNLEVANAHTFFVGVDGAMVHNGVCSFPKAPRGKGSVPVTDRDKKRAFDRDQVADALKKNDGKCIGCDDKLDLKDAKGHHIDRHADGGLTIPANLATLCPTCHKNVHSP